MGIGKRTEGPWTVVEPAAIDYRAPLIYGAGGKSLVAVAEGGGPERAVDAAEARANAAFIAMAERAFEPMRALYDIICAIRDEQISDEIWGGASTAERREASQIYAARILAEAGKISNTLDAIDAALAEPAEE